RLSGRAAGAGAHPDRELAAGRRHAGAAADRRRHWACAGARDPASGRRGAEPDPPGQGRADLFGHADEQRPRHADDGAVARRSDRAPRRRLRSRAVAVEPSGAAGRDPGALRFRGEPAARPECCRRGAARRRAARRGELAVDEQSIWKKELSFGRKKKPDAPQHDADASAPAEKPASIWKKEISLGRKKPPAEAAEPVAVGDASAEKAS